MGTPLSREHGAWSKEQKRISRPSQIGFTFDGAGRDAESAESRNKGWNCFLLGHSENSAPSSELWRAGVRQFIGVCLSVRIGG